MPRRHCRSFAGRRGSGKCRLHAVRLRLEYAIVRRSKRLFGKTLSASLRLTIQHPSTATAWFVAAGCRIASKGAYSGELYHAFTASMLGNSITTRRCTCQFPRAVRVCRRARPYRRVRLNLFLGRHFGAGGTSPYRLMTATSAALSGGPPAFATAATSLKYWAPMSGDRMISARAMLSNGLENA